MLLSQMDMNEFKNKIRNFKDMYKQYPTQLICDEKTYIMFCRNAGLPTNCRIIIPAFNTLRIDDCTSLYSVEEEPNIKDAFTEKREELIILDIKLINCVGWLLG